MSDNDLDDELLALADEEEGEELSAPGSPESLGSGAMEESESEADADGEEDEENPFPLEGKFKNEKDKQEIMAMTEVQREELLADRAAEQERRLQDLQLRKLLAQREKDEEAAKKKRKAGLVDLDESQRKSSRQKTKQSETLDNYKKAREARGKELERQRQRGRPRSRSGSGGDHSESDRDAEGEDEVDWLAKSKKDSKPKEDPPATLEDVNMCRIGRAGFSEVCFYPGFEDAITGTYCRMNVGPKEPGSDEYAYRMMQIKGFVELPEKPYGPYILEWAGKKYMTDQYAILAEGKAEKRVQFSFCSNSRIMESEFEHYKAAVQGAGMRMPTKSQLEKKFQDIQRLRSMKFSSDDIQYKLSKQNKYADRLVQNVVSSGSSKPKTSQQVMQERLQEINRTNRRMNQQDGRKAMIIERKREIQRRAIAQKERERKEKEDAERAAKEAEKKARLSALGKDDLFDSDISRSNTPGISRSATPLQPKRELKGIPTFTKKKMDDDVIASLDMDIDIDI